MIISLSLVTQPHEAVRWAPLQADAKVRQLFCRARPYLRCRNSRRRPHAHFIDVEKRRKNTDEKFVTWNNGEFRFCLSFATALQLPRQHGELVRRQHRRLARCHPQQGTNAIEKKWILARKTARVLAWDFQHWKNWYVWAVYIYNRIKEEFLAIFRAKTQAKLYSWIGPQGERVAGRRARWGGARGAGRAASRPPPEAGAAEGQFNWIKFLPEICPSCQLYMY